MFYSYMYKKYYPFQSSAEIQTMFSKDKKKLIFYIKKLYLEAIEQEMVRLNNELKRRQDYHHFHDFQFPYLLIYCNDLADKVNSNKYIDKDDIRNLNTILYRHKYNWFLSMYIAPIDFNN